MKTTKRALLSSVLALVLCFAMLLGTTYAWFTDSVTSGSNKIVSGTLDVEMYWADGAKAVPTADEGWTDASEGAIFNYSNWEPGFAMARHIKIANEGTLALKYQLKIVANGEVSDLSDVIDVYYADPAVQVSNRTALDDSMKLGTLTEILAGIDTTASGSLAKGTAHTVTLVLKMQESAGNEYQNKSIGTDFSVILVATQEAAESDSFGNDYDNGLKPEVTYMFSGSDLHNSTDKSGNFGLSGDIKTSESDVRYGYGYEYIIRKGADYTLDLNGKNIDFDTVNENANNNAFTYLFVANHAGTKLTIDGEGKLYCHNSAGYTCAVQGKDGTLVTINGGEFQVDNGIAVWAGAGSHMVINGGSFVNGNAKTDHELIYSSGGVIDIYGGFFHNTDGNYTLNVEDRNRATAFINVYGGTYVNFNPATGGQDPNNIKVAEGYTVIKETQDNGDVWYTVIKLPENTKAVSSAQALTEALNAGKKVALSKNITLDSAITISNAVDINLGGHTLTTNGLKLENGGTIINGKITSGDNTNMVPHISVSGGELTMENVTVEIDKYLNHQESGNKNYSEFTGLDISNATAVLNNCNVYAKNDTYCTWSYVYGITANNATVTINGGTIKVESVGAAQTDLKTAISGIGTSTVTLNNVDVDAATYGTTMGNLTVNTTDKNVTDTDFVSYGGTYTLKYIG